MLAIYMTSMKILWLHEYLLHYILLHYSLSSLQGLMVYNNSAVLIHYIRHVEIQLRKWCHNSIGWYDICMQIRYHQNTTNTGTGTGDTNTGISTSTALLTIAIYYVILQILNY